MDFNGMNDLVRENIVKYCKKEGIWTIYFLAPVKYGMIGKRFRQRKSR